MNAQRVDFRRRTRVVSDAYCPRCLTPTDRSPSSRVLRVICRLSRVRLSTRLCAWCGWQGWRIH